MWKLSIGIILGGLLFALGIWGTHATGTLLILGWIGVAAAWIVWLGVVVWAASGKIASPF